MTFLANAELYAVKLSQIAFTSCLLSLRFTNF